jgi:hypothetical protein
MSKAFDKIAGGLNEALEIVRGKPCHGCEQRRVLSRIMIEATKEWAARPMKPINDIFKRLRDEAIARGELDKD